MLFAFWTTPRQPMQWAQWRDNNLIAIEYQRHMLLLLGSACVRFGGCFYRVECVVCAIMQNVTANRRQ